MERWGETRAVQYKLHLLHPPRTCSQMEAHMYNMLHV